MGCDIDLTPLAKKLVLPREKNFRFIKVYNPNTSRWS